jgi:hypothetical protein
MDRASGAGQYPCGFRGIAGAWLLDFAQACTPDCCIFNSRRTRVKERYHFRATKFPTSVGCRIRINLSNAESE